MWLPELDRMKAGNLIQTPSLAEQKSRLDAYAFATAPRDDNQAEFSIPGTQEIKTQDEIPNLSNKSIKGAGGPDRIPFTAR